MAEYVAHDHIFAPPRVKDTSFRITPSQREQLVRIHERQPVSMHVLASEGALEPIAFEIPQDTEFFMGCGGLYSTAPDYLKLTDDPV